MMCTLFSECSKRLEIVRNKGGTFSRSQRVFAGCEMFCFPASMISLMLPVAMLMLNALGFGHVLPEWCVGKLFPVLISAAVGYLTNWLAILMLFHPYREIKWLIVWKQGLFPRNRAKVATSLGTQVGGKLFSPHVVASRICEMLNDFLTPDLGRKIKGMLRDFLKENQDQIVAYLIPRIQVTFLSAVDKYVTVDDVRNLWDRELAPRLEDEETRRKIAAQIVKFGSENAPQLVAAIRAKVKEHLKAKLDGKPIVDAFSDMIVEFVMENFAEEAAVQQMIVQWLSEEETLKMLKDKTVVMSNRLKAWMNSDEGKRKITFFTDASKDKLKQFICHYLETELPAFAQGAFESEKLWLWIENEMLPNVKRNLIVYVKTHRHQIVQSLNIPKMIENGINSQPIEKFHAMINDIAAEQLGAIQVLGYFLGAAVGFLQLLV